MRDEGELQSVRSLAHEVQGVPGVVAEQSARKEQVGLEIEPSIGVVKRPRLSDDLFGRESRVFHEARAAEQSGLVAARPGAQARLLLMGVTPSRGADELETSRRLPQGSRRQPHVVEDHVSLWR